MVSFNNVPVCVSVKISVEGFVVVTVHVSVVPPTLTSLKSDPHVASQDVDVEKQVDAQLDDLQSRLNLVVEVWESNGLAESEHPHEFEHSKESHVFRDKLQEPGTKHRKHVHNESSRRHVVAGNPVELKALLELLVTETGDER